MDLHSSTKEMIELMQDSLHLDIEKKYELQKISDKLGHEELDKSEKELLNKLGSGIKEDTIDVRILSRKSKDFTNRLLSRTLKGFSIVLVMYSIAFVVGLLLIAVSLILAFNSSTPNEYLASFFGAAGVFDISFLLYKPAKEIQRSRGNATQLWMAFSEWQYISIWSGKTYNKLFSVLNPKNDQTTYLEQMIKILKMKAETTVSLIESIEKNVAARPDEKSTRKNGKNGEKNGTTNGSDDKNKKIKTSEQGKKKPGKQNSNGKKKDQNGGRHNEEHGGEHHGS